MQDINWDDLRYFLAVARRRSFAGAARTLTVNESTIARRIARLETKLGAKLFERNRGYLQATTVGEEILHRAERMELEVQTGMEAVSGTLARVAGTVRITAVPILVNHVLVPELGTLLPRHPDLNVELIAEARDLSLTKREADIALRLARPHKEARVIARRVGRLNYAVYAAKSAIADRMPWLTFDDRLVDLPQTKWIEQQIGNEGGSSPRLIVNDAETMLQSVLCGHGKSLLPVIIGNRDDNLVPLDYGERTILSREIWLLVHPDLRELIRVRTVINWLADIIQGMTENDVC